MSEEKKLTGEKVRKAVQSYIDGDGCVICPYYGKGIGCNEGRSEKDYLDFINSLQAENERLKINLANEKKWGKIQAKQAEKETARAILGELDLFFKGTTFRQGYEFKKINEKLKEMAKNHDVEVDYEN